MSLCIRSVTRTPPGRPGRDRICCDLGKQRTDAGGFGPHAAPVLWGESVICRTSFLACVHILSFHSQLLTRLVLLKTLIKSLLMRESALGRSQNPRDLYFFFFFSPSERNNPVCWRRAPRILLDILGLRGGCDWVGCSSPPLRPTPPVEICLAGLSLP